MPYRTVVTAVAILFLTGVIAGTFSYGPSKRKFVEPRQSVTVPSAQALTQLWDSTGVHGRVAVIFARHLNQQFSGGSFPEMDYLDKAMRRGLVRKAYYIVPDRAWPQVVSENIAGMRELIVPFKTTDAGFTLLHIGGRINVMPLSKYIPEGTEPVLTVLEPEAWSPQEQFRINTLFSSGLLTADLQVTIAAGK